MADDITLTVRVRDLTQGDFARLNGRLQRMRQSLSQVGSSGRTASASSTRLSNDIDRLGNSFLRMRNEGTLTNSELTRMRGSLRGMARDARTSMRAGDLTRSEFRNLRTEIRGLGRDMDRLGNGSWWRRLVTGVRTIGSNFSKSSRFAKIFLAVLVLIGPAAQALGALLVTALAGAFIALGAFALRGSAQVKSAFMGMKSTVGSVVRDAALPLQDSLVGAIDNIAVAARRMQPALTAAFAATAPLVNNFIGAFSDLAEKALPGIVSSLSEAQPVMAGFRGAMGDIGEGIGKMFAAMTANGGAEALKNVWLTLGSEIENLLVGIGEFVNMAAKSGSTTLLLVGIFRSFSGALNVVEMALTAVDGIFGSIFGNLASGISGISKMTGVVDNLGTSFQYAGKPTSELKKRLADVKAEIADIRQDTKGKWYELGLDDKGEQERRGLNKLVGEQSALEIALAQAESSAAAATTEHAMSMQDLITAMTTLTDLNRGYFDAQAGQQQAIDDAQKKFKEAKGTQTDFSNALKITKGQLDLTKQSGRDAYEMLSNIGKATKESTDKAVEAKAPWEQVRTNWANGYAEIVRLGDGMGLTKKQARDLANQILGMPPSLTVEFKARKEDLISGLDSVKTAFATTPNSMTVTVSALTGDAIQELKNLGFKVESLPNGKTKVTAATASAIANLTGVRNWLNSLDGQTAHTYVYSDHINTTIFRTKGSLHDVVGGATGGLASGLKKFAGGGSIAGGVLDGPGTKTSDSLVARLSRGEFVMRAAAVDKYGPAFMTKINNGLYRPPGFAKGGKVSQATKDARNELRGSFGISPLGRYAGYQRTPFERSLAVPDDVGSLVANLNKAISDIRKAFSGKTEKNLVNSLNSSGRALIRQQKNLDKVNKSLEKAKTKLDDLKQSAAQLKESVTTGVLSATNVTQVASGDNNVTMRDVMAQMRTGVDKSSAFASALTQLKAKGVSKDIINQISEAGISGGGLETAGAILSGSSSEIQTLNDMQAKINSAAGSAGKTASDAMYAAGIKAADGLVKGLQKKQDAIEAAMLKIAKSMEKAIKRALGIKSPSKVMEKVGDFTAEGFAIGMHKNSSVDAAWSSMLGTSPASGAPRGSGGGGVYTIPIYVGGKFLDEVVLDTNRRLVRTRGGNVQKVFGR